MIQDHLTPYKTAQHLERFGYPAPTGVRTFSDELREHVRAFQRDAGLPAHGHVTQGTVEALEARPELRPGDTGPHVRALQHALNGRGHRLRVTGVFALDEVNALREYEGQAGITRSGTVTEETWKALGL